MVKERRAARRKKPRQDTSASTASPPGGSGVLHALQSRVARSSSPGAPGAPPAPLEATEGPSRNKILPAAAEAGGGTGARCRRCLRRMRSQVPTPHILWRSSSRGTLQLCCYQVLLGTLRPPDWLPQVRPPPWFNYTHFGCHCRVGNYAQQQHPHSGGHLSCHFRGRHCFHGYYREGGAR